MRLAVVGCGAVAECFHLPAVERVPGVKLCALVEKDPRRLWRFGVRKPRVPLYRDIGELPFDTEAAVVTVPNALHAPITIDLLRRGIHVLCEKPMATTVESCRDMIKASRNAGAVLMIGHHKRFVPSVTKAKDLLEQARIGRIRSITGSMGMPRTWQSRSAFHLDPALAGGGVLIDNGVHLIDLVVWLLGSVTALNGYTLPEDSRVEEDAKIEFRSAGDTAGVLRFSHRALLPNVMRIEGEQGFLEFDTYDYPSLKVFAVSTSLCRKAGSVVLTWPRTSPYEAQLEHFVRRIRGMESITLNEGEEAMEAVSVVMQVYKRAGRPGG